MGLTDRVYSAALASLRRCCHAQGMYASGQAGGHLQIWARDSMMSVLGGVLTNDRGILSSLHASVRALRAHQASNGCIPNNVDPQSGRPNFRAYADGGLWWIVGSSILEPDLASMDRVLLWYECQDVHQSGLISMQESSDWQDLFCTRGKGLYLNCMYAIALAAAAKVSTVAEHKTKLLGGAQKVRERINRFFWYNGDGDMFPAVAHTFSTETPKELDSLGRKRWLPKKHLLVEEKYYLPYLSFRTPGEWFDTLGHLLAILSGVASEERTHLALDFITRHGLGLRPAIALYPAVQPGTSDWRPYYGMLNIPHHYHNGGIWPFIGGFYVAALVHAGQLDRAKETLGSLAELLESGGFNEWHHGVTAEPMGVRDQAWSSAMYLYAWHCVEQGRVLLLPSVDS